MPPCPWTTSCGPRAVPSAPSSSIPGSSPGSRRIALHKGEAQLAPGITLHHIGGHTAGIQCVRVHTRRGWVVVASDTTHYYEHFETGRSFGTVFDVAATIEGYDTLHALADSPLH